MGDFNETAADRELQVLVLPHDAPYLAEIAEDEEKLKPGEYGLVIGDAGTTGFVLTGTLDGIREVLVRAWKETDRAAVGDGTPGAVRGKAADMAITSVYDVLWYQGADSDPIPDLSELRAAHPILSAGYANYENMRTIIGIRAGVPAEQVVVFTAIRRSVTTDL